jgi:RecB family exonuclease
MEGFSPSSANELLRCQLRVAFRRDEELGGWARPSTYSSLGTVAHAVTERAYLSGNDVEDVSGWLEATWDEQVAKAAERLEAAWAPAKPPSANLWPGYQLTRARTLRRLNNALSARQEALGGHGQGPSVEVALHDTQTGLFGRVDRIEHLGSRTRVVDLKSGLHQGEPSEDQRRQLLLYAVLLQRESGEWPTEVAIEDASGALTVIKLDPQEAEAALADAVAAVSDFNSSVQAGTLVEQAEPDVERCQWCPFRVVCGPYWQQLRSDWSHRAVLGRVEGVGGGQDSTYVKLRISSPVDLEDLHLHIAALPIAKLPEPEAWIAAVGFEGDVGSLEVRARWSTEVHVW